jgi:putative FmdB family regulatory protein
MPTYDYKCSNCGFEFEEFQSIMSEPIKICPSCGQSTVYRKVSGGAGLIFKGSGFYITDYAKKNNSISTSKVANDKKKRDSKKDKKENKVSESKPVTP